MNRENLFAYTAATGLGYPPYVSINRLETGDVEVTVRAAPKINQDCYGHDVTEGKMVSVVVPAADWDNRPQLEGGNGLANIEGDEIVIRVPIATMQYAACGALEQCRVEVTDDLQAAKGVVRYLNDEDEEGSTLVHFALDKALKFAVENGEEGFEDASL